MQISQLYLMWRFANYQHAAVGCQLHVCLPIVPSPITTMPLFAGRLVPVPPLSSDIMIACSKPPHVGPAYGDSASPMWLLLHVINSRVPTVCTLYEWDGYWPLVLLLRFLI